MFDDNRIIKLSKLFAEYKAYPVSKYTSKSPMRCFQHLYPKNYFASQIKAFLKEHEYEPTQRGADLPWWGLKYFTDESGRRVMIISQDSQAEDAGSVVFWAFLYPMLRPEDKYSEFTAYVGCLYKGWRTNFNQINAWKINLDFCYITDASKVYKDGSWKSRDFDHQKSKALLEKEIEFCNPDIVVILGASPLTLLLPGIKYADTVETEEPLLLDGRKCIVAPFPSGQGPTQKNFKKRLETASGLIRKIVEK